ncbi:hypothetical protein ACCS91_30730 [Rhizobium ruizarguesonis]|uniref:hypothetical protein n=1 Tax=Rhizobium ruizarguesonis TaxID=2081791 RepID=UPI001FE20051|nr:hypothetical protein [Rhizobium ruizarguesonis]
MTQPAADKVRFNFVTQCPRDDGCGVFVLQMLTGKPYDQLAGMIDWGVQTNHYTTWKELRGVLTALGWQTGGLRKAESWGDVCGVAVVHVEGDHFILYDGDNGVFYDPGQPDGPDLQSGLVPMNYLPVQSPESGA